MRVIGIDEVGRGAWAGPMLFVAVVLKSPVLGLKDSKKLSKSQRNKLADEIKQKAGFVGYGWVSPSEIDDLGLTKASELACTRALVGAPDDHEIIVDGKINYCKNLPNTRCEVGGDNNIPEISAASIVAKVTRDARMAELDHELPGYGFIKNVGYGTKAHISAIDSLGLTPMHRWSYKPLLARMSNYET